jgi:hypothetical protein
MNKNKPLFFSWCLGVLVVISALPASPQEITREISTPSAVPPTSYELLYTKTLAGLCAKDSNGIERCVGSSGLPTIGKTGTGYILSGPKFIPGSNAKTIQTKFCGGGLGNLACSFDNPTTAGSQLIVVFTEYQGYATAMVDSLGNTITNPYALNYQGVYFVASNIGGGDTFSATAAASGDATFMIMLEATGVTAFDVAESGGSTVTYHQNLTATTTAANDVLYNFGINQYSVAFGSPTCVIRVIPPVTTPINNTVYHSATYYLSTAGLSTAGAYNSQFDVCTFTGFSSSALVAFHTTSSPSPTGPLVESPVNAITMVVPQASGSMVITPIEQVGENQTGQTQDWSSFDLYTAPANAFYNLLANVTCDTSVSGTETLTLTWSDPSGTVQTLTASANCTTLGASSWGSIVQAIRMQAGTSLNRTTSHTGSQPNYDESVALYQISTQ